MSTSERLSGDSVASSRGNGKRSTDVVRPWAPIEITRDGRHVVAINLYPRLHSRALNFLRASDSPESINNAILQWRADELEAAAQDVGVPFAMVRTNEEFRKEPVYAEVLSRMPMITLQKIGDSEPVPFKRRAKSPLEGIRSAWNGPRHRRRGHRQRPRLLRCGRPQHLEA